MKTPVSESLYQFCAIFKNTFFTENLLATASIESTFASLAVCRVKVMSLTSSSGKQHKYLNMGCVQDTRFRRKPARMIKRITEQSKLFSIGNKEDEKNRIDTNRVSDIIMIVLKVLSQDIFCFIHLSLRPTTWFK